MKKIIFLLFALIGIANASAAIYKSVDEIQMVYLEDSTRYVCDPDHLLSPDSIAQMDAMIRFLEDSTSIQIVVVAVEKLASEDCYQFALDLGKKHGIGQKKTSNGMVILLSTQDRCIQFATGSGLEGYLPDAICDRIQRRYMDDAFREGDWNRGLTAGVRAVCGYLDGSMKPEIDNDEEGGLWKIIAGFFGLIGLGAWWANRKAKTCPKCKAVKLVFKETRLLSETDTYKRVESIFVCSACGHIVSRPQTISKLSDRSRRRVGTFSSGSDSSERDPGGHFGGGHFGGGGSGHRF